MSKAPLKRKINALLTQARAAKQAKVEASITWMPPASATVEQINAALKRGAKACASEFADPEEYARLDKQLMEDCEFTDALPPRKLVDGTEWKTYHLLETLVVAWHHRWAAIPRVFPAVWLRGMVERFRIDREWAERSKLWDPSPVYPKHPSAGSLYGRCSQCRAPWLFFGELKETVIPEGCAVCGRGELVYCSFWILPGSGQ